MQQTANFNISGDGIIGGNLDIGATPQVDLRLDVNGNGRFRTANGNAQIGFDIRIPNMRIRVRTFVSYQEQSFYDSDFFITVY
jgi:hypothetical protein